MYKIAREIYIEEVKNKGLFIPRLSFQDEMNFQFINALITDLATRLNAATPFRRFWMINKKRQYNQMVKEMKSFMDFWAFPEYKKDIIRIEGRHGEV